MFGIGGTELFIIALFAFLIFGPDKVPELARTIGKAMRVFKQAQEDMERVIRAEVNSPGTGSDSASTTTPVAPAGGSTTTTSTASSIWAATEEDEEEDEE